MQVGIANKNITPQSPMEMMGYGDREHSSVGVHDSLQAYALYVEPLNSKPWCWVSVDLCLIGFGCGNAIKREVSQICRS